MFHPEGGSYTGDAGKRELKPEVRAAKEVCSHCPVRAECRAAGMGERQGIWGGLDEVERQRLRAERGQAALKLPKSQRLRLGGRMDRYRQRTILWQEISRQMGLPEGVCQTIHAEWAAQPRPEAPRPVKTESTGELLWPTDTPAGYDGWVRRDRTFYPATYVGQDAAGAWLLMHYRSMSGRSVVWIPAEGVRLTRNCPPVIRPRRARDCYAPKKPKAGAARQTA